MSGRVRAVEACYVSQQTIWTVRPMTKDLKPTRGDKPMVL
jgi:hypothetical protein